MIAARALCVLALAFAVGCSGSSDQGSPSPTPGPSGSGDPPDDPGPDPGPRPGVVVQDTQAGTTECVPLCTATTDPAADGDGDDWAFESGSCVIPGTLTGHNQPCTTGEPIPEPESVPGVVVADNSAGTIECYPICQIVTDPAQDPEMDDWSWENNRSCVIPGTPNSFNQECTTGEPVPDLEPRPGILVAQEGETECVPLCVISTMPSDGSSSDWAYENNASCILPGSPSAEGRRECTFGVAPDYSPPALTGPKVSDGFFVSDGQLVDAYGAPFVIRGVNNAHIWFDGYAEYKAYGALDNIQSYGTNTIRVVWETTGAPDLLADILHHIVELEMVPMVELHDATGVRDPARLLSTAEYYTRPEVVAVLKQFREYLLVNIANEWSGGEEYVATYQTTIDLLRAAGVEHTLVIDASGFGQNARSILDNAATLTGSDPLGNLLFSVHMYDLYSDPAEVDAVLNEAVSQKVPLIVGEFGHQLMGTDVAWQAILDGCQAQGLGYIAWSWTGNDADTAHLDMAEDWEGPLTTWGEEVLLGSNGIQATAQKASIFE